MYQTAAMQPLFAGYETAPMEPLFAAYEHREPIPVLDGFGALGQEGGGPGPGAVAAIGVGALVFSLAVSFAISVGTSYLGARWALRRCGRCG